jgi:hypothetical protein
VSNNYDQADTNINGPYVPDCPDCVATERQLGRTRTQLAEANELIMTLQKEVARLDKQVKFRESFKLKMTEMEAREAAGESFDDAGAT